MSSSLKFQRTTLMINSKYRNNPNGTPTSNFVYTFKQKVENVVHVNLKQCVIENGIYNINASNNQFTLKQNIGSEIEQTDIITIPTDYYDDTTFMETIAFLLNSANKTTVSETSTTLTNFFCNITTQGFFNLWNDVGRNWSITFDITPKTALLFGFNVGNTPIAPVVILGQTSGPFYIARPPNQMKLSNYDSILIQSDRLGNEIASNQGFSAFWSIPNGNWLKSSTTITYENVRSPVLDVKMPTPRDIEWVDVRIIDNDGQEVGLNGNDVHLIVEFYTLESARK